MKMLNKKIISLLLIISIICSIGIFDDVKLVFAQNENKENNVSSLSEINNIDEEIINKEETIENETDNNNKNVEIKKDEENIDIEEYKQLDLFSQILYSSDKIIKNEGVIEINDNIDLIYPLYINNDDIKILNLNGYELTSPEDDTAIYIYNDFSIYGCLNENVNKKLGSIKSKNNQHYAIYVENSNLNIENISIQGANNQGVAIYLKNSNITIDNCFIYGGKGYDTEMDDIAGIGGNAIVVDFDTNDYFIEFRSGIIKGGDGGNGYHDFAIGRGGSPIVLGNVLFATTDRFKTGSDGDYGGGDGGYGIFYIRETDDMSFLKMGENAFLYGGDGGKSIRKNKKSDKKSKKTGSISLPSKFDLRKYTDEKGNTYSLVASLHDQKGTGLCNTFTTIATAENYLLKNQPEKVTEMGYNPKKTYTKNFPKDQRGEYKGVELSTLGKYDDEIDLSEAHLAYHLRYHPLDPLGNAGESSATSTAPGKRYYNVGSSENEIPTFLSNFRPIVSEKELSSQVMTDEINAGIKYNKDNGGSELSDTEEGSGQAIGDKIWETDDTINRYANYEGATILKSAKIVKSSIATHDEFIQKLKETVYTNGATALLGNFKYWDLKNNIVNCVTGTENEERNALMNIPSYSGGGHAVACIGWDDNFPASKFDTYSRNYSSSYTFERPRNNGALLVKQSTNGPVWTWIYYDSVFDSNWSFVSYDWMLPKTYYDNCYYYDGGTSPSYILAHSLSYDILKIVNVFKIKNNNEKASAISFVSNEDINIDDDNKKPRVQFYKTSGLDSGKKAGDFIVDKPTNLHYGLNFIELDEPIELEEGQTYAVAIDFQKVESELYKSILVDKTVNSASNNINYKRTNTVESHYYTKQKVGSGFNVWSDTESNFRIKLITTNTSDIIFDANEGHFGTENTKTIKKIYGEKIYKNNIENPTRDGYEFLGWSENKNSENPTIDDEIQILWKNQKTYFAIYKKLPEPVEPETSPTETSPPETSPTETDPPETSPTETDPPETSPTETNPPETSPTETNPPETSPTETNPPETSPTETDPPETSPPETSPTETNPPETSPTETNPPETSPTETNPPETSPTETNPPETSPTETNPPETSQTETTTSKPITIRGNNNGGGGGGGGRNTINIQSILRNAIRESGPVAPNMNQIAPTESSKKQILPITNAENTKPVSSQTVNQINVRLSKLNDVMAWGYDTNSNNWSLTVFNDGKSENIKNSFYVNEKSAITNKDKLPDVYYLDNQGNLVTGFVNDTYGNSYYMNPNQGANFGKLERGWVEVNKNQWCYFQIDGRLLKNSITPDGYYVNENGLLVTR